MICNILKKSWQMSWYIARIFLISLAWMQTKSLIWRCLKTRLSIQWIKQREAQQSTINYKMREKWLKASIYLNPQFLTCRFPMADLPLVQTWNLPKFLPKLMTKICKDMVKYARISEKWRKVKRLEKPENTGNMKKIKILFICHGNICRSTMAQSIFTHLVHRQHLDAVFEIDSAATSREE